MQAQSSSQQASRQETTSSNQASRQSSAQTAQSSRQNYASNYDGYYRPPAYGYGGAGGAYAAGVVTGAVIGSTMTAAAYSAQAASCTTMVVNGITYSQCGSTWYQPTTQGSQVTYVVVNPPK